uniref:Uncharacterized protein n=1 Tax=Rhipicephalus zambeziensis TaxID=60191 RepID=A0A224YIB4_9ACAR
MKRPLKCFLVGDCNQPVSCTRQRNGTLLLSASISLTSCDCRRSNYGEISLSRSSDVVCKNFPFLQSNVRPQRFTASLWSDEEERLAHGSVATTPETVKSVEMPTS